MKNYQETINSSAIVLIEFYASWCPHCQRMAPVVKEAQKELEGTALVYQYDIDENKELASEEKVETIPTFIIYKDGRQVWRNSGEMTLEDLVNAVRSVA